MGWRRSFEPVNGVQKFPIAWWSAVSVESSSVFERSTSPSHKFRPPNPLKDVVAFIDSHFKTPKKPRKGGLLGLGDINAATVDMSNTDQLSIPLARLNSPSS